MATLTVIEPGTATAKKVLRFAWVVAIATVTTASLLPSSSFPMRAIDRLHISDKMEHLAAYAVLAFLPAIHERRKTVIATASGVIALGVLLEFGQLYSGWRDFEVADMVADAAGVGAGVTAGILLRSRAAVWLARGGGMRS
jgi:VanZ family protein